mmetsp:Transcript_51008/g.84672  ORF Transcript_51008/g.84672 Transcript_51008/m.84672 type:complete len:279 (-) Transcript_51008:23-859(-)
MRPLEGGTSEPSVSVTSLTPPRAPAEAATPNTGSLVIGRAWWASSGLMKLRMPETIRSKKDWASLTASSAICEMAVLISATSKVSVQVVGGTKALSSCGYETLSSFMTVFSSSAWPSCDSEGETRSDDDDELEGEGWAERAGDDEKAEGYKDAAEEADEEEDDEEGFFWTNSTMVRRRRPLGEDENLRASSSSMSEAIVMASPSESVYWKTKDSGRAEPKSCTATFLSFWRLSSSLCSDTLRMSWLKMNLRPSVIVVLCLCLCCSVLCCVAVVVGGVV